MFLFNKNGFSLKNFSCQGFIGLLELKFINLIIKNMKKNNVTISVNSDGVITDIAGQEVNFIATDISASNGIIHVIDTVLLPLDWKTSQGWFFYITVTELYSIEN